MKTLKDIKKLENVQSVSNFDTDVIVSFVNGAITYDLSMWTIDEIYEDVKKQGNLL